jgi:hypothetical protein
VLGWAMKHFRWPRPPFVLGFILGEPIERYMFISIERYGVSWMIKPFVLVMFGFAAISLLGPLIGDIRSHGGLRKMVSQWGHPRFSTGNLFPAALLILFVVMLSVSFDWAFAARIVPTIVGVGAILFCSLSLINDIFGLHERGGAAAAGAASGGKGSQKIHMDIVSKTSHLPGVVVLVRGFAFFGWMISFMAVMAVIGLIPTVPIFIILFMRTEARERMGRIIAACFTFSLRLLGLGALGRKLNEQFIVPYIRAEAGKRSEKPEPWKIVIPMAAAVVLLIYVVFDQLLAIPWPPTLLGAFFPILKAIPSV